LSQGSVDIENIQNTPSIKAILAPYTTDGIEVAVIDRPPVSPSISFYPVKGDDTNVKILLNSSTGDYMDRPVQILDTDAQFYEEEYFGQTGVNKSFEDIRSENRKIQFKSDDPVDKYQLFRISNMPTSYRDFNNNFVEVDPEIGTAGYYLVPQVIMKTESCQIESITIVPARWMFTIIFLIRHIFSKSRWSTMMARFS
jgi:hypothetical protein